MNYVNPPVVPLQNVYHKTFHSRLYGQTLGYNIYLPPEYAAAGARYPVAYHLHGWTGNESSELQAMRPAYTGRQAITVFPNSSPVIEDLENLPVEAMLVNELLPHIDESYRTDISSHGRAVSGFSMGGGAAFYYAAKHPELFSSVTAYAGTYHHYYHKDYQGVAQPPERAPALYQEMMVEERYLEDRNILSFIRQNAETIRAGLKINMRIGTQDPLFCDNEILHLYLNALDIPHTYTVIKGVGHELAGIV